MTDIDVHRLGDSDDFEVDLREGDVTTSHRVTVPADLVAELGVADVDPAVLVRESVSFLLEREPNTSIMLEFSLAVIPTYFPEYRTEIVTRLSP